VLQDAGLHAGGVVLQPEQFVEFDGVLLALHVLAGNEARGGLEDGAHALVGGLGGDDLSGLGLSGHARGDVDGITEDVVVLEDGRPEVHADPDGERELDRCDVIGAEVGDSLLHVAHRSACGIDGAEGAHDFVADELDDPTLVALDDGLEHIKTARNHPACHRITVLLVELGAAGNVREDYD
jgi:hypothetical protein